MAMERSPGVLIIGGAETAKAAVARAEVRLLATIPLAEGAQAIADRSFDALLIEAHAESPVLDGLLERAGAMGSRAVLSLAPSLIDAAWDVAPEAHLLSRPSIDELAAAIVAAVAPVAPRLAERRDQDKGELLRLSAEAGRLAQALADLSIAPQLEESAPAASQVRALIRARRLRDRFLDAALFADPAWDMMLDLYAARIERKQVAVSSLCIAAAVPPTTALRWLRGLTDAGAFLRVADATDGRRFFVTLSEPVNDGIAAYFAELRRMGLPSLS